MGHAVLEFYLMENNNSYDNSINVITALLHGVQTARSEVFNRRSLRLTTQKVRSRIEREGVSFLTKSLPRLGKALDRALTGDVPLDATGFRKKPGSQLPMFMGELFELVFSHDGMVLPSPCVLSIQQLRQVLFVYYKYELPYTDEQEQKVISAFKTAEDEIKSPHEVLSILADAIARDHTRSGESSHDSSSHNPQVKYWFPTALSRVEQPYMRKVIRRARSLLNKLFLHFDPTDIVPRHGPGAVSTKEKLWDKYRFTTVSDRIADVYPPDAYFRASMGHVCDTYNDPAKAIVHGEPPARVVLVPKDSRGPRLISCEPLAMQWVQQGLGAAIVRHVEHHPLTRHNVHFTDQGPNKRGALLGSSTGRYATLDLKEASDRVTLGLVRVMFPSKVLPYLEACRSLSTELPDGSVLALNKFAPMGSALCFPVLALTVWAILTAGASDADARESILVYGDDVVVQTAEAAHAIKLLESFGLKVNRDKSCVTGFFRESCGTDAYNGYDVTPLRLRKLWPTSPSPESYVAWIAYANQFYDRKYYALYWLIVDQLMKVYGEIPSDAMIGFKPVKRPDGQVPQGICPSLREVPDDRCTLRRRVNKDLQRVQVRVRVVESRKTNRSIDGWAMLLRYFTEGNRARPSKYPIPAHPWNPEGQHGPAVLPETVEPFSVSSYTKRGDLKLVFRWR